MCWLNIPTAPRLMIPTSYPHCLQPLQCSQMRFLTGLPAWTALYYRHCLCRTGYRRRKLEHPLQCIGPAHLLTMHAIDPCLTHSACQLQASLPTIYSQVLPTIYKLQMPLDVLYCPPDISTHLAISIGYYTFLCIRPRWQTQVRCIYRVWVLNLPHIHSQYVTRQLSIAGVI